MRAPNLLAVSSLLLLLSQELLCVPPEVQSALWRGAKGRATLSVVDSKGNPVEQAKVSVAFWLSDSVRDVVVVDGVSDRNGLFVATGKTKKDMEYTVKKDGYYATTGRFRFYPGDGKSVHDGRWQPWNPTESVVLKEKRKPIAMYAKRIDTRIPVQGSPVGFDLEKGDWVAPHGSGKTTDILFTYRGRFEGPQVYTKELQLAFPSRSDGLKAFPLDKRSEFASRYTAVEDGYVPSLQLQGERTTTQIIKAEEFGSDRYLVLRVRSTTNQGGTVASALYGKIYGPIEYGFGLERDRLRFVYYLNPTPNDLNLEFDLSRNLFGRLRREAVSHP